MSLKTQSSSPLRRCPSPTTNPVTTTGWPRTASGVVSTLVLALAPMPGQTQHVVEIDDLINCPACVIETGPPVTLAPPTDHVWFRSLPAPGLVRDSEGNYIMFPVEGDGLIGVFGADGRYRSSYGRIGEGPGEFAPGFGRLLAIGEGAIFCTPSLGHIFTCLHRRPRATWIRSACRSTHGIVTVLKSGTIAVQATVRAEAGITTIQILRPDGSIEASIAPAATNDEQWDEWKALSQNQFMVRWDMERVLERSSDHMDVWSAHRNRYRISRYGRDGVEKVRIERISKWFEPYFRRTPGALFRGSAEPSVASIHEDADGLLWVAVLRAPSSFSPPFDGPTPTGREVRMDPYLDMSQFLHTTVEILDPVAGEVVVRREFDEYLRFVGTPGDDVFTYSLHPDALGNIECTIRPLRLRRE